MKTEHKAQIIERIKSEYCPYCGSSKTYDGNQEVNRKEVRQVMYCEDCDYHWTEVFKFHKVILTDMPEDEDFIFEVKENGEWETHH